MRLSITRLSTADEGTRGRAVLDGNRTWECLELPWRENRMRISCIPPGLYQAAFKFSPHFQRELYELLDVPGRSEILIHSGNFAGDKSRGYASDVTGCILLGQDWQIANNQLALVRSRIALADFHFATAQQPIEVEITWAEGAAPEVVA